MKYLFEEKYGGFTNLKDVIAISEIQVYRPNDFEEFDVTPDSLRREMSEAEPKDKFRQDVCIAELFVKGETDPIYIFLGWCWTPNGEWMEPNTAVQAEYSRLVQQWKEEVVCA